MVQHHAFLLLASILVLAGCAGTPPQQSAERPRVADPDDPYITYVKGMPPLVTDRFLLESGQQIVGAVQVIEANYEDTFVDIARAYNLGFDELLEANPGVDPWLPGAGTRVVLPTRFILPNAPYEGIVINLANKRIFWFVEPDADGQRAVMTFPIGIGTQGNATPTGITDISMKVKDPTWFVPAAIRAEYAAEGNPLPPQVPPGPDNPLGDYALLLGMPSYLIHGTNRPAGVGMRVSHGCVRLFPENIEVLYREVPVKTPVTIVNQPWLTGWDKGELFLEAHAPLEDDFRDWPAILPNLVASALQTGPHQLPAPPDPKRLTAIADESMGIPMPVLGGAVSSDEYLETAQLVNNIVVLPPEPAEQLAGGPD